MKIYLRDRFWFKVQVVKYGLILLYYMEEEIGVQLIYYLDYQIYQ